MDKKKKKYAAPSITLIHIEMENGVAAGSATTTTTNSNGEIKDEWMDLPNDNREIIF